MRAARDLAERRTNGREASGRAPTAVEHWASALATRARRLASPPQTSLADDQASWRMPSVALVAGFIAMPLLIAAGLMAEWLR